MPPCSVLLLHARAQLQIEAVACWAVCEAGELGAIKGSWPKIKFHALRTHAGLVFQKQWER